MILEPRSIIGNGLIVFKANSFLCQCSMILKELVTLLSYPPIINRLFGSNDWLRLISLTLDLTIDLTLVVRLPLSELYLLVDI